MKSIVCPMFISTLFSDEIVFNDIYIFD